MLLIGRLIGSLVNKILFIRLNLFTLKIGGLLQIFSAQLGCKLKLVASNSLLNLTFL